MAGNPWWVLVGTPYGSTPQYIYFQDTKAGAEARASKTTEQASTQNLFGPYKSKADAEAAVKSGDVTAPNANTPAVNPFQGIADTAHALSAIGAFFRDAWKKLTDGKMWRSLGWLLLGILLIFAGLSLWIGGTVNPAALLTAVA